MPPKVRAVHATLDHFHAVIAVESTCVVACNPHPTKDCRHYFLVRGNEHSLPPLTNPKPSGAYGFAVHRDVLVET